MVTPFLGSSSGSIAGGGGCSWILFFVKYLLEIPAVVTSATPNLWSQSLVGH